MLKTHLPVIIAMLIAVSDCGAQDPENNSHGDQIRATLREYVAAFNQHDSAAVAAHWAENAVYTDRETGERVEGREALQADFEALFADATDLRLSGEVVDIHMVTADVANVEGTAVVFTDDADPAETEFTATFVKSGEQWLLHSVHESDVPAPESPFNALQPLAWMIGDWVDESDSGRVDTSVRWAAEGSFLIRSFVVSDEEGPVREGTQIIGWDPRAREIRSWSFNSDGSFGDGAWSQVGDGWHSTTTQTLADGDAASGTFVITSDDEQSMTIKLIGHEIEGAPQPASEEVTIVRATEENTEAASETESGSGGGE